jgi:hypothetical protein
MACRYQAGPRLSKRRPSIRPFAGGHGGTIGPQLEIALSRSRSGSDVYTALAPNRRQPNRSDLAPIIAELRAAGITSLNGIADALNAWGVPTAAGGRRRYAAQVSRVLARLPAQPPLGCAILHRLAAAINATIRHGKS